jgi:hypothetical protein
MTTHTEELASMTADRAVWAFHQSRGIRKGNAQRLIALNFAARLIANDETGSDLDDMRETATATLIEQDFRAEPVALFLDDLCTEAMRLAWEAVQ